MVHCNGGIKKYKKKHRQLRHNRVQLLCPKITADVPHCQPHNVAILEQNSVGEKEEKNGENKDCFFLSLVGFSERTTVSETRSAIEVKRRSQRAQKTITSWT